MLSKKILSPIKTSTAPPRISALSASRDPAFLPTSTAISERTKVTPPITSDTNRAGRASVPLASSASKVIPTASASILVASA